MVANNSNLHKAKTEKNDEFYTQLTDIEKELAHYRAFFRGKTVYCNCDDPQWSNFFRYFRFNFNFLGLRKLIATHYEPDGKPSYKLEITESCQSGIPSFVETPLESNGDFRSDECVELLKECDVVCTNPPFSLFREFITLMEQYGRKYIVLGNINAVTYSEVFPLIKNNRLWLGASIHSGDREFRVPDTYPLESAGCRIDAEGNKYIRVKGVRWFTNVDYGERHNELTLFRTYNPETYPRFDTYDAINVDKTVDIPMDYCGLIGVPITFLDKFSPEQFEIIGTIGGGGEYNLGKPTVNGKDIYKRIIIRKKQ